jgi:hypothetical protein
MEMWLLILGKELLIKYMILYQVCSRSIEFENYCVTVTLSFELLNNERGIGTNMFGSINATIAINFRLARGGAGRR